MSNQWSNARILALNSSMGTVQLGYAIFGLLVNPFLEGVLQFSPQTTAFINCIGPIAGFVVQPLVGMLSDLSTFHAGKRRPYIAAGSLLTAAAYILFLLAAYIQNRAAARALAVLGMVFTNVGMNSVLGPFRALCQEVVPMESRDKGNSFAAVVLGSIFALLNFVFFGLCFGFWGHTLPSNISTTPEFKMMFVVAVAVGLTLSILFIFPTWFAAPEKPADGPSGSLLEQDNEPADANDVQADTTDGDAAPATVGQQIVALFRSFRGMTLGMAMVLLSMAAANAGFFSYQMFLTTDGCLGAFIGSLVTAITCLSSFGFSFFLPRLMKNHPRLVWAATQAIAVPAFVLFLCFPGIAEQKDITQFLAKYWWVMLCAVAVGLNQAAMNSVPFALIGRGIAGTIPMGTACSIINMALVIGQMIALVAQSLLDNVVSHYRLPFTICTAFSAVAVVCIVFINERDCKKVDSMEQIEDEDANVE